jgi:hypothetical protein
MSITKKIKASAAGFVKDVSGTAGEACENSAYTGMVARYGEEATVKIIAAELEKAGETLESFKVYRRVKSKIQNNEISFLRADAEASEAAQRVIGKPGLA